MKTFTTHTGVIATLNRSNVDTDAIIPKQFLKSIKRSAIYIQHSMLDVRCSTFYQFNVRNMCSFTSD